MRDTQLGHEENGAVGNLGRTTIESQDEFSSSPAYAAAMFSRMALGDLGLHEAVSLMERWLVLQKLRANDFNQSKTAGALKIHRNTLRLKLNEWGYDKRLRRFA